MNGRTKTGFSSISLENLQCIRWDTAGPTERRRKRGRRSRRKRRRRSRKKRRRRRRRKRRRRRIRRRRSKRRRRRRSNTCRCDSNSIGRTTISSANGHYNSHLTA
jgi:hypothetical protein